MNIAILGAAHMHAHGYARCLARLGGVRVTRVYDRNPGAANAIAALCGAEAAGDADACLGADTDAVVICSENALHAELGVRAAAAGKAILCEKPLAPTAADCLRLADAVGRAGGYLQVAFPCRYHPTIERARKHLESGKLGSVLAVRGTNHGRMPGGWFADPALSGGGAMMDHTVHVVDLLRHLLKIEVDSVYAETATRFHPIPVEDTGILSMSLSGGAIATLDASWSRPQTFATWGDVTIEFIGERGTLYIDMFAQAAELYGEGSPTYRWLPYGDDMDERMLRDFIARVETGMPSSITVVDGLRATEVVEAAYRSAATGTEAAVARAPATGRSA